MKRTARPKKRRVQTPWASSPLACAPQFTGGENPYIASFLTSTKEEETTSGAGVETPLALDVVEGKTDPLYSDHPYHTKVPYRAILRYVLHYTRPGDVVLDGFCGSGMTGAAAQLSGDRESLESIGLRVGADGVVRDKARRRVGAAGARSAVLADLSPLAGLLAFHHNSPIDPAALHQALAEVIDDVDRDWGWLQATLHEPTAAEVRRATKQLDDFPAAPRPISGLKWGAVQFVVWSDVFECSECGGEWAFFEEAVNERTGKVEEPFPCPHCEKRIAKRGSRRVLETRYDPLLECAIERAKQTPVRINYEYEGRRYEKRLDAFDCELLAKLEQTRPPFATPCERMPPGRESRRNDVIGLTHVHHFYPPANLWLLAALAERVRRLPDRLRQAGLLVHSAANLYSSRLRRFRAGKKGGGPLSGTLYVSSLNTPASALQTFRRNARVFVETAKLLQQMSGEVRVSVQSSTRPLAPPESIDYVFVDPPFGGNIMYAELNFLWEAWLGCVTDSQWEAVENPAVGKGLEDYQRLLTECFRQFYAALKTGRWLTVVFHHSDRRVWHALQAAIRDAGFLVVDVRTLDKRQDSFKQLNHAGSVKHDLVISARKPAVAALAARRPATNLAAESQLAVRKQVDQVWRFVERHLRKLDRAARGREGELRREREESLLFSRVVAECVRRDVEVPISAAEFYAGLRARFDEREGLFYVRSQEDSTRVKRALPAALRGRRSRRKREG